MARRVALGVIFLMTSMAALGYLSAWYDIEALRKAGKESIAWSATQLEVELNLFNLSLAKFRIAPSEASLDQVKDRFDILWSRASVFEEGSVGERLRVYDAGYDSVAAVMTELREHESEVVGLTIADPKAAFRILAHFEELVPQLKLLSNRVILGEEAVRAEMREQVRFGSQLSAALSFAAVFLSLAALTYIWRESRRVADLAEHNRRLAETADKANKAKSRFLTMMSHELRTPMNGVLGLLALARQHGLPPRQTRLLDQAERSGRQMIGMLADILDFSALQDDKLQFEFKPFEPAQLALAIGDIFEPVARRENIAFTSHADPSCPPRVKGDFRRLRQAIAHIATYVVETAGTRDIDIALTHGSGMLTATVSFHYADDGKEWRPDLILGAPDRDGEQFASDALGPAVARGLIEHMGGAIRLGSPDGNRIAIHIIAPVEVYAPSALHIATRMRSVAIEAICKSALRSEQTEFLKAGDGRAADVVLIEAGGEDEARRLDEARISYPGALLVAIGRPNAIEEFDARVELPLDAQNLRSSVLRQLAS
jgi:signal transduction histidine kinase